VTVIVASVGARLWVGEDPPQLGRRLQVTINIGRNKVERASRLRQDPRAERLRAMATSTIPGIPFFDLTDNKQQAVSVDNGPVGFSLLSASAIAEGTRFTCFEPFAALSCHPSNR
jgi:hypothetical protein